MSNLAQRWTYRHGIKGLGNSDVVVTGEAPIAISDPRRALQFYGLYGVRGRVGQADVLLSDPPQDIELAMYGPYGSRAAERLGRRPDVLLSDPPHDIELAMYGPYGSRAAERLGRRLGQEPGFVDPYVDPAYTYTDPSAFSDFGVAAPSTVIALPDGTSVNATGAIPAFDPASQQSYLVAADGTKIYDDGTVLKPGGDIMTPGGTVVHSDGSLTLANGDRVAGATPTPDGTTVASSVAQWFKVGVDVATGVSGLLGKLGIITPQRPVAGAVKSGWVSGTQYRTTTGAVVTPVKLPDGLYQLPDGTKVGAPPSSGTGTLLLVGGAIAAAFAFMRGRKAAA